MKPVFRLVGSEIFRIKRRWMPYVLLISLAIITLLPIAVEYINYTSAVARNPEMAAQVRGSLVLPEAMNSVLTTIPVLGMFLVVIFTASVIGTEYGWGTLRPMLARGNSRSDYLTSKLISATLLVTIGILIVALIGFIATLITSLVVHGNIVWSGFAGYFFSSIGRILLVLFTYLALAALFAILLRSALGGIAVAIAWYFGGSIIVSLLGMSTGWLSDVATYMLNYNAGQLLYFDFAGPPANLEPWYRSEGILVAYMAVFIAAAYYFFKRQDLT